ncbi:MAG: winged helix DNA-binding domain-containing protein [Acidimicrobiales bacterium]
MRPVVTVDQRRARLGRRHALAQRVADPVAAAEAVVALHATDPASVYLSAAARCAEPSIEAVADALYRDRTLTRVLGMRRTLFVVPTRHLLVVERSSTVTVAENERRKLLTFLAAGGVDDPATWLAEAAAEIEAALPPEGASARQLTALVPRLATKLVMGAGTKNEAVAGATSRVVAVLASEGVLIRGTLTGSWTGRQYRWYRRSDWLDGVPPPDGDPEAEQAAAVELVRRWLGAFGPGSVADLAWWTGWTLTKVRAALTRIETVEVDLDGDSGLVLADDVDDLLGDGGGDGGGAGLEPWVALLPALDPTPMGWKERAWYLGPHKERLFDRNGNVGPTVWADGRIVGGWGQRSDGSIAVGLLDDIGTEHRRLLVAETERLAGLLGHTVVKPSFPTPLQRELAAGNP